MTDRLLREADVDTGGRKYAWARHRYAEHEGWEPVQIVNDRVFRIGVAGNAPLEAFDFLPPAPAGDVQRLREAAALMLVEASEQYDKYALDTRTTKETLWILRAREEAFREVVSKLGAEEYVGHFKPSARTATQEGDEG